MTMVSYAQNHEDVLLDRAFPRGKPGFYIDVGANEPVRNSVTKHFYELGWHGINVEPGAHPFALLAAERQRDVNLNVAVSDTEGELTLYELPPDLSGGSTLSEANAARHREAGHPAPGRTVATLTLAQLCERAQRADAVLRHRIAPLLDGGFGLPTEHRLIADALQILARQTARQLERGV